MPFGTAPKPARRAVLKTGGCLLATLDNLNNPVVRLRNATPWWLLRRSGLVPYPAGATVRLGEFCRLLQRVGFEISEIRTLMHVPRSPAVLLARLLYKLGKDRFTKPFCKWAGISGGPIFCPSTGKVFGVLQGGPVDPKGNPILGLTIAEPVYPAFEDRLIERLLSCVGSA